MADAGRDSGGKCTADTDCPTGRICVTETGAGNAGDCVTLASTTCSSDENATSGTPGVCKDNSADMCCTVNDANQCIAGSPASHPCCVGPAGNMYCQSAAGLSATNAVCDPATHACVACTAVSDTNPVYIVDPINGDDTIATGNPAAAPSCAFKSITAALAKIGTTGTATTVAILGGTGATGPSTATGETFPITIPANVTVTTTGTAPVTITASVTATASASAGFVLSAAPSAIEASAGASLTIAGATTNRPAYGVVAEGNASASTVLKNLTVTGFTEDGVEVTAGTLSIAEGLVSTKNGGAETAGNGLAVNGGTAVISPATGGAVTSFDGNTGYGISVSGSGAVTLTGVATAPATGTVTANKNGEGGISFAPPATGTASASTVTGLLANGSTAGSGAVIAAGSNVTITASVFLLNSVNGVIVDQATGSINTTLTNINLGTSTAKGGNTFQAAGADANGGAGVCLDLLSAGLTLSAGGDIFASANCSTTSSNPTLSQNSKACTNVATCTGGICDLGLAQPGGLGTTNTNTIRVAPCTE